MAHIRRWLLQLILFSFLCVWSCSALQKTESKAPVEIVYGSQMFKDIGNQNGDILKLRLEIDLLPEKSLNDEAISTYPEVEGQVFSMENEIRDLKLQVKEMKELVNNLSIQISRISELEEKVMRLESRSPNLKEQAEKVEKRVVDQTCQVNISKLVSINGLNEQIMKDIKSGYWNKTVTLMRRYLNNNTLAYEQLDNIILYNDYPLRAAAAGYVELIKVMLDNGLPINMRYFENNMTILHKAAGHKQCKLVNFLIQQGPDVNVRELRDYTPLHYAAYNNEDVNIVQLLVDSGADIDAQDNKNNYNTALHWAAEMGRESVVQYLVNKGCNTTITNNKGKTAADLAKTQKIKNIIQNKS